MSKFAFAQLVPKAGKLAAAQFLRDLIAAVPYRINIVPTDNGIQFTNRKRDTSAFEHIFDRVCREHKIQHRLTVKHPWTNGQVERMNRTIKKATVKRFHYDTHDQLERHLAGFLDAYNYARRWKTPTGLTPYEFICKTWTNEPKRFNVEPGHHMTKLNSAFTDHVFAITSILGHRFIPRLRDLPSKRFYVVESGATPAKLKGRGGGRIREGLIASN